MKYEYQGIKLGDSIEKIINLLNNENTKLNDFDTDLIYKTGSNSLVLYDKTPVPVTTKGTLVPPLTTNKALATVPLLTNGANKVASKLPYNPILKSPVKYPNLTDSENKFLNDYMGKEIPGKNSV